MQRQALPHMVGERRGVHLPLRCQRAADAEGAARPCRGTARQYARGRAPRLCPPRDDRRGAGARHLCRDRRRATARDPLSFALRTRIFDLSGAGARCGETAPFRLTRMIAVTLSLLTAAPAFGRAPCRERVWKYG